MELRFRPPLMVRRLAPSICRMRYWAWSRAPTSCTAAYAGSLPSARRNHDDVKKRAEINRTGKKMYRQRGRARRGTVRQRSIFTFRGGGRSFGPTPRSHAIGLPKKVRLLALKHALSAKARDGEIILLEKVSAKDTKTEASAGRPDEARAHQCADHRWRRARRSFALAARNVRNIDVLPVHGINVYDILRRRVLVLTRTALEALEARLS